MDTFFMLCSCGVARAKLITGSMFNWANGLASYVNEPSTAKGVVDACLKTGYRPILFRKVAVNFWASSISEIFEYLGICKSARKPVLMYKLYRIVEEKNNLFSNQPQQFSKDRITGNFRRISFQRLFGCLSLVLVLVVVHTVRRKVVWSSRIIYRIK